MAFCFATLWPRYNHVFRISVSDFRSNRSSIQHFQFVTSSTFLGLRAKNVCHPLPEGCDADDALSWHWQHLAALFGGVFFQNPSISMGSQKWRDTWGTLNLYARFSINLLQLYTAITSISRFRRRVSEGLWVSTSLLNARAFVGLPESHRRSCLMWQCFTRDNCATD